VHQLPPICGKPAFALVDPTREEMLVMVWQQGGVENRPSQRLYPVKAAEPDFYAQMKSKPGQQNPAPASGPKH
jgi:hypothetical protein